MGHRGRLAGLHRRFGPDRPSLGSGHPRRQRRFFPSGYPSVIGQDLLERGFPRDAASSQVVLVFERARGKLTEADLSYVEREAASLYRFAEKNSSLGLKKIDTHRTPVVGPRLVSTLRPGAGQAVLTIVSLNSTHLARSTRLAVDKIETYLADRPAPPAGLESAMTGSAVVGRDMNKASKTSIDNTTYATIVLVVIILLVVYRSPLLALTPLLTIALSVKVGALGDRAGDDHPQAEFPGDRHHEHFRDRGPLRRGDGLLPLPDRPVSRGADPRPVAGRCAPGGDLAGGRGPGGQRGDGGRRPGDALVLDLRQDPIHRPGDRLELVIGLVASLTLAPVLLHWLRGAIFWPFRQPHHEKGADVERESLEQMPLSGFWLAVADLVVRRPGVILAVSVLVWPIRRTAATTPAQYSQLADLNADRPSVKGANVIQKYFAVGEIGISSVLIEHPKLDFRQQAGRDVMDAVSRQIAGVANVAEVRSVSQPLGKPVKPAAQRTFAERYLEQFMRAAVDSRYVSLSPAHKADRYHITRVDVVFKSDPFSDGSLQALESVLATVKTATSPGHPLAGASRSA